MTQQGMRQQGSTPGDRADGASDVTVAEVRFEHHRDSFGIGEAQPRLSWIVDTTTVGWRQTGYEIEAYRSDGQLRERTERVESDQSALVSWPFAPLSPRERLTVRVSVWGDGGYGGRRGLIGGRDQIYGARLAPRAELEVDSADGTCERIVTDQTWRSARGPSLVSDIYDGEAYDARLELPGWSMPGYDDHDWVGVRPLTRDLATLVAPSGPPVRRTEMVTPVAITRSPTWRTIVDFGQNLVGRLRLTLHGEAGQTVTLRHA